MVTRQVESYILLQSIWEFSWPVWAVAAHKPGELPKLMSTEYMTQPYVSPCTICDRFT